MTTAEGLWNGTSSNGRAISGLVLDDGTYWVLYSLIGNNAVIAGAVQGNGTSQSGTFTSSNGRDFNLEGTGIRAVTIGANYVAKTSFNGSLSYTSSGEMISYSSSYDTSYDLTPSLGIIAGTYSGSGVTSGGVEFATVAVSASGTLMGVGASGCTFSGNATPRARGNVYNVSVTFDGGICANGRDTVTGVAYYDAGPKQLVSAALNSTRSNGFIFAGTKP